MQENENNINYNINNIDIDMDDPNLTGSDIDDPKYIPSNNILENNKLLNSNLENKNEEMFLKTKLISLQNDANFSNQKRQELLNKNLQLKQELAKLKENIKSKEGVNSEFQNYFFDIYKQNFEQYEEKNNLLKKKRDELKKMIEEKDKEIKANKKVNINKESNVNNDSAFNKLQNDLKEKSIMLNKEFAVKEEKIKNRYLLEISNATKKIDELKEENEKLRNEISNYKMEIE